MSLIPIGINTPRIVPPLLHQESSPPTEGEKLCKVAKKEFSQQTKASEKSEPSQQTSRIKKLQKFSLLPREMLNYVLLFFSREETVRFRNVTPFNNRSSIMNLSLPEKYDIINYAALNGSLVLLRWARENDYSWYTVTSAMMAQGGHLEMLKWACENSCPWEDYTICQAAAYGGHLEVLKWARKNG